MLDLVQGRGLRCDGECTHDRCAGICYLDGADISEVMVHRGLARDCPRYSQGRYAETELQAAAAGATIGRSYAPPGYCRPR
jgi:micrococcal nuclease